MRCQSIVAILIVLLSTSSLHAQNKKDPPKALSPESLLTSSVRSIDLASALKLAGVYNPEIMLARERIVEAVALRQLAAVQILPTLNVGTSFNQHTGVLQGNTGEITKVNRESMYVGMGANAVAAGSVNIPGLVWNLNVSDTIYRNLVSRAVVTQREFASEAIRNDVLLRTTSAYLELLRATGRRAITLQIRDDAKEVTRVTSNFAKVGQGRDADARRSDTEYEFRIGEVIQAEAEMQLASARLCQLLNLDPSLRLEPSDGWVVPSPVVPDPIPLMELLGIALTQRPELKERQSAIRAALLELKAAKALPFSPNLLIGFSAGDFGGGSDIAASQNQPRFGNISSREDLDVVMFWSLRNLGVGNVAIIRLAASNERQSQLRQLEVLDRVRSEVANASARTHARFAQIETNERAVQASQTAFKQDLLRTKNNEGLPIEVLDSLRLLSRSRIAYLDAIVDYNRAQIELYVALGQPPAGLIARPIPTNLVPAPTLLEPVSR